MNRYSNEIKEILLDAADDKTKEKVLRLTSGAKCLGVSVPSIRLFANSFRQKHPTLTIEELCSIMDSLCMDN